MQCRCDSAETIKCGGMVQACNEMGCKRDLRDWGTLDGGSQTSSLFSMTDLEVSLTLFPVWSFYLVGWSWGTAGQEYSADSSFETTLGQGFKLIFGFNGVELIYTTSPLIAAVCISDTWNLENSPAARDRLCLRLVPMRLKIKVYKSALRIIPESLPDARR